MEMHQLRYVLALADELTFTCAAERTHVTQPTLTRAIEQLEQELGSPLFQRKRTHTHLADFERMVLPHPEQIQAEAQQAKLRTRPGSPHFG